MQAKCQKTFEAKPCYGLVDDTGHSGVRRFKFAWVYGFKDFNDLTHRF